MLARAVSGFVSKMLVAGAIGVVIAGTACLGSLPGAVPCPPAPVYRACALPLAPPLPNKPTADDASFPVGPPGPPVPGPPVGACDLDRLPCVQEQGRTCTCSDAVACKRSDTTCSPAPDCPRSIRDVESRAICVETSASFGGLGGPQCACGCASCAAYCDGQGPILGPKQTIRFDLPGNLPSSGRLGVMVRMRGSGRVVLTVRGFDTPGEPLGEAQADTDFSETIVRSAKGTEYAWSGERLRPSFIELIGTSDGILEVDCVVPFLSR